MLTTNHLIQSLEYAGFEKTRIQIYIALLSLGKAKASEIAKKAGLQRTAVYDNLEKLHEQGLITIKKEQSGNSYTAVSPERLTYIMRQRAEVVMKSIPVLKALFQRDASFKPVVRFFEGAEQIKEIHREIVAHNEEKFLRVIQTPEIITKVVHDDEFLSVITRLRVENEIRQHSLRPLTALKNRDEFPEHMVSDEPKWLREIRYLPKEIETNSIIYIWDDKIAIVSSEGENYVLVVESKDFTKTVAAIFDFLWTLSTPAT